MYCDIVFYMIYLIKVYLLVWFAYPIQIISELIMLINAELHQVLVFFGFLKSWTYGYIFATTFLHVICLGFSFEKQRPHVAVHRSTGWEFGVWPQTQHGRYLFCCCTLIVLFGLCVCMLLYLIKCLSRFQVNALIINSALVFDVFCLLNCIPVNWYFCQISLLHCSV